jgi:hypothetical protein
MKIFKKDGQPQPTKLEQRIASIGTAELVTYVETSLFGIGKNIAGSGPKTESSYLEAEENAVALLAIVKELKKRAANVL